MKKSITGVVALLAGAFVAHSQGTVSFANYGVLSTYIYVQLGATKLGGSSTATTGTPASDAGNGNDWTVALYGAAGANDASGSLAQLETATSQPLTSSLETGGKDSTAGTWLSTLVGVVPNTTGNGSAASVQVYAWYNDNGTYTSYSAAQTAGVPTGFSTVANTTTGGPNTSGPASTATPLPSGLGNISLTSTASPEPSTIALGVMGASAFLLRLRKKQ
jgi:hypothetical protein